MIRFPDLPDVLFRKIFVRAFEELLDHIEDEECADYSEKDKLKWVMLPEEVSLKYGTLKYLKKVVSDILAAFKAKGLYDATDYHWEIIYYALNHYKEVYDDMATDVMHDDPDDDYVIRIDGRPVLDLSEFDIGSYLWDVDFTFEPELVNGLGGSINDSVDFSPELFGVVNGMMPHPDELKLEKIEDPKTLKHWVDNCRHRSSSWRRFTDLCNGCCLRENIVECLSCRGPVPKVIYALNISWHEEEGDMELGLVVSIDGDVPIESVKAHFQRDCVEVEAIRVISQDEADVLISIGYSHEEVEREELEC